MSANSTGAINSAILNSVNNKKASSGSSLQMDDFFALLAAQLRNQDPLNPMDNNEFMAQMAQFTMLEEIETLTQVNYTAYAMSMVGQQVTTASVNSAGDLLTETGIVTGVGLFESTPIIYVGDKAYTLQQIMAVGRLPAEAIPNEDTENAGGNTENGNP